MTNRGTDWRVVIPARDIVGEGPLYVAATESLYWVDIAGRRLHRIRLDGTEAIEWAMPSMCGFIVERAGGGFVVGLETGLHAFDGDPDAMPLLLDPYPHQTGHRLNDATVDPAGRLWIGTMTPDGSAATGQLLRVHAGAVTLADDAYLIPNGPAFGPPALFHHADSLRRVIYRFDVADDGTLQNRREHIRFPDSWGLPDGMTVDADNYLWVAHWDGGRLSRFDPDGDLDRTITLPASRITSCAFAGPGLDRLFVTSAAEGVPDEPLAGALFEVDPAGARGVAQPAYAG